MVVGSGGGLGGTSGLWFLGPLGTIGSAASRWVHVDPSVPRAHVRFTCSTVEISDLFDHVFIYQTYP